MFRRKLFLYSIMYAAGITAGFFMFERSRIIEAVGLVISIFAAILYIENEQTLKKTILIILVIAGFLSFNIRAASYDLSAARFSQLDEIEGIVVSLRVKDDVTKITIKTKDENHSKIIISAENDMIYSCISDASYPEAAQSDIDSTDYFILIGAFISARGEYKELESADNPGCFDYRLYMRSKGVSAEFRSYIIEITDPGFSIKSRFKRFLFMTREAFINRFDEDIQGFIRGVIFGDKTEIEEDIINEFNSNSTGHILAVSGLHMGFLYSLLRFLTGRKKSPIVSGSIIAVILLYGEMTMWSPATVRACIVMTISLLSVHFRRRPDLLTSISLASLIILSYEPYQLFNSGFQMSFLALLGIVFLTKPIASLTGEALGVMIAVQAGTLPVTAYTFGRIDPLSIFINVPVILLSSVLVPFCILLLMIETVFGRNISPCIDLASIIGYAVIKINHILNFNGMFSFTVAGFGTMALIAFYLIIFSLSSEWVKIMILRKDFRSIVRTGVIILMPVIMISSCFYDRLSNDEIVFVAVGQGDCTHIRAGDIDVLIDGGGVADYGNVSYSVGEKILMPYLLREGCKDVDIALVTHLHTDHYKGIAELSEIYPVGSIGIPIDYRGAISGSELSGNSGADLNKTSLLYVRPDMKIRVNDEVSIEVLWPVEISMDPLSSEDPNEHNTVYMIEYKGIKTMITGDLLEEDEREMIRYYEGTDRLNCDILKVAHHGSKSSSCEEFLDAASPEIAVIQAGRNNFYGHPHKQTLERLEERGIRIFRTDVDGAVGIDIHGNKMSVDIYKSML